MYKLIKYNMNTSSEICVVAKYMSSRVARYWATVYNLASNAGNTGCSFCVSE